MTAATEYLTGIGNYIRHEESKVAIERLPDDVFAAVREATEELNGGDEPGLDCKVAVVTDTLDDFEAARRNDWRECLSAAPMEFGGFKAVKYEGVQPHKGAERADRLVIDAGEYRIALY